MSKLTDIIRREVEGCVAKQSGLTVTPAVITAVREDYLRADVKLLGNGTEIKNMLNKSSEKLTVGQTVTVAYSTLPSSGVILIANGEADPLAEGGGWEVENAVLFDEENLHDYVVDTELMTDISANTKLYYGASNRLVVAQGMLLYLGTFNSSDFTAKLDSLLTANAEYLSHKYEGITSYYYRNGVVYKFEVDLEVFPSQIYESSGRWAWYFGIVITLKKTDMSTSAVTTNTYTVNRGPFSTTNVSDITDYGLILRTGYFGAVSPNRLLDSYIPNGYVGGNYDISSTTSDYGQVTVTLVFKNADQNKWNADYGGTIKLYGDSRAAAYMPLSAAETCFALGATQRTEPVTPGGGS